MILDIFKVCLGLICLVGVFGDDRECRTAKNEYGVCIKLRECTVFLNLLERAKRDNDLRAYLRNSTCSSKSGEVEVCCPREEMLRNPSNGNDDNANNMNDSEENRNGRQVGLLSPPDCGFSNVTNYRVVGGVPAKLNEFPWMVALGYKNKKNPKIPRWLCGGSLITKKHILTAAHCVVGRSDLFVARVGELDLYDANDGANPEDIPIVLAKYHENYSPTLHINDIAILTLERAPNNRNVWPICLPHAEPLRSNSFLKYSPIVAGWGSLFFDGPTSSILQLAEIPVVSIDSCRSAFGTQAVIDNSILCAGWLDGKKDACQGDSGGPLMYGKIEKDNLRFYQIGVVSYGFRCAEAGYPGVYSRVTHFIDWISQHVN